MPEYGRHDYLYIFQFRFLSFAFCTQRWEITRRDTQKWSRNDSYTLDTQTHTEIHVRQQFMTRATIKFFTFAMTKKQPTKICFRFKWSVVPANRFRYIHTWTCDFQLQIALEMQNTYRFQYELCVRWLFTQFVFIFPFSLIFDRDLFFSVIFSCVHLSARKICARIDLILLLYSSTWSAENDCRHFNMASN